MKDIPDAAIYCSKHIRTMEILTFLYIAAYCLYFYMTTVKKLEEFAFGPILVRLLSLSQEIAKNTQTNHQEKARVNPENSMTEAHILMSRILILKFIYLFFS